MMGFSVTNKSATKYSVTKKSVKKRFGLKMLLKNQLITFTKNIEVLFMYKLVLKLAWYIIRAYFDRYPDYLVSRICKNI